MVYRVMISGEVQGVGFRFFVQNEAISRGWAGEVWNRPDHGVEAVIRCNLSREEIVGILSQGPGHIKDIRVHPGPDNYRDDQQFLITGTR